MRGQAKREREREGTEDGQYQMAASDVWAATIFTCVCSLFVQPAGVSLTCQALRRQSVLVFAIAPYPKRKAFARDDGGPLRPRLLLAARRNLCLCSLWVVLHHRLPPLLSVAMICPFGSTHHQNDIRTAKHKVRNIKDV